MDRIHDFQCSNCGNVIFDMPESKIPKRVLIHSLDELDEKDLINIATRFAYNYIGHAKERQTVAQFRKVLAESGQVLPKGYLG